MGLFQTAWGVWRAGRRGPSYLHAVQKARLAALVGYARNHSRLYEALYRHLPPQIHELHQLPPVTKPDAIARFDDWITDPRVTRAGVEVFLADTSLIGCLHLDRYGAWTTSGSTGTPGIFLHDRAAITIYNTLLQMRGWPKWIRPADYPAVLVRGFREAIVTATGGHFASVSNIEYWRQRFPRLMRYLRIFSVLSPLAELVQALNDFQPTVLFSYPSALKLLAAEQAAGRLKIRPVALTTAGESLDPETHRQIETAFKCRLHNVYGASEFAYMAFACRQGWLHVNADWVILEPVDASYQPVPPGHFSHTVLVTNLANRIQPILRYELGDSIVVRPDSCPCGNPLPAIRVEGRRDEILALATPGGEKRVQVLPLALGTVVEETPGVHRFQVIQTGPATLTVRLEVVPGADEEAVWQLLVGRLQAYLATHDATAVTIQKAVEPPQRHPASGKFRQVWAE